MQEWIRKNELETHWTYWKRYPKVADGVKTRDARKANDEKVLIGFPNTDQRTPVLIEHEIAIKFKTKITILSRLWK